MTTAIALEEVADYCDAVLVAWYGGQAMGTAVRQLLYGEEDCFGRLPVTFYRSTDQLTDFESYDMTGRTYRYLDPEVALFPFGYGLSYSFYQLYDVELLSDADSPLPTVSGTVSQCNTDVPEARSHKAVVQVYLQADDHYTDVYYTTGTHFLVPFGLGKVEARLDVMPERRSQFLRLGRKFIINRNRIFRINTVKEQLFLADDRGNQVSLHISKPVLRSLIDMMAK